MCIDALNASQRPDEQKLILTVMEIHPSVDMLQLAARETKRPALKEEATRVMTSIAHKLSGSPTEARNRQAAKDPIPD